MATYRSALGRPVDMTALVAKNEKVRAVGNMKVNARGDTIDSSGKVIKPVTEKVNNLYNNTVVAKNLKSKTNVQKNEELTDAELEIENSIDDDLEIEKIKAKELSKKNGK